MSKKGTFVPPSSDTSTGVASKSNRSSSAAESYLLYDAYVYVIDEENDSQEQTELQSIDLWILYSLYGTN